MNPLYLELVDTEYPKNSITQDRQIVRAIVFDDNENLYFVRASRDDEFGKATLIETSGGGVENGEDYTDAIKRELQEELGASVDVLCEIGTVSDYYNLIHRHNINHYYLCHVKGFSEKNLTKDEMEYFHLQTLKCTYSEAEKEYEKCASTKLGRLLYQREMPILQRAKKLLIERKYGIKIGKYRHYKGNEYEVIDVATHSETLEPMVVYRALYGNGDTWVRPLSMWNENVHVNGKIFPRFEYIG